MITAITQFPLPKGIDLNLFRAGLAAVAPAFQRPEGLLSKAFVISEDRSSAGGVYLWQDRERAKAFEPAIRSMIKERLGVDPVISYFETPVVVDNRRGKIDLAET